MAMRPWLPTDLGAALVAWWDAQQGVAQAAGLVSQWADVVSGLPATQATGSAQPTYSATARNGKPGIVFASGKFLSFNASTFPAGSNASTAAMAAYTTTDADGYLIGWGSSGAGRLRSYDNNNVFRFFEGATAYSAAEKANGFDRFVVHQIAAGATPALQYNIDGSGDQVSQSGITLSTTTTNGIIGRYTLSNAAYWVGPIQQLCVFNRTLTVSERQQLEGWESWYDGKAGSNLPANHPYKAAAPTVATADPAPSRSGSAAASLAIGAAGGGAKSARASASGGIATAAGAMGRKSATGTAAGQFAASATAIGAKSIRAAAAAGAALGALAAGRKGAAGPASGAVALAAVAVGAASAVASGSALAGILVAARASGAKAAAGPASSALALSGRADGAAARSGSAMAGLALAATAVGVALSMSPNARRVVVRGRLAGPIRVKGTISGPIVRWGRFS